MASTNSGTLFNRYSRIADETHICMTAIIDSLLDTAKSEPDTVRQAIGSVAFRKLEEYKSLRDQREAAFTEWFHEISTAGVPFG